MPGEGAAGPRVRDVDVDHDPVGAQDREAGGRPATARRRADRRPGARGAEPARTAVARPAGPGNRRGTATGRSGRSVRSRRPAGSRSRSGSGCGAEVDQPIVQLAATCAAPGCQRSGAFATIRPPPTIGRCRPPHAAEPATGVPPVDDAVRSALAGRSVFVTGHTGFKGSWLSLWLDALGAQVTGYALDPPTDPSNFEAAGVADVLRADHRADLRDRASLEAALRSSRPDVILHLAAQSVVLESYAEPSETFSVNVMGTAVLLDAIRAIGRPAAVVIVTSDKCYANDGSGRPFVEDDPLGGHDPYSASKAGTELVAAAYRASFFPAASLAGHGVAIATARAGNVIGGGDWTADGLVADAVRALDSGRSHPPAPPGCRPAVAARARTARRLPDAGGAAARTGCSLRLRCLELRPGCRRRRHGGDRRGSAPGRLGCGLVGRRQPARRPARGGGAPTVHRQGPARAGLAAEMAAGRGDRPDGSVVSRRERGAPHGPPGLP